MGLFTRDFSKPGKGVEKDEPQKNALFHFFELVGRKFFRLITFNLFYLVCMLPIVIAFYNLLYTWLLELSGIAEGEAVILPVLADLFRVIYTFVPQFLHIPLLVVSIILYGPITMGFTYVLRNFVREEHAWTSDFFSRAFSNFKQGLFFGLLDVAVTFIFYINWNYGALIGGDIGIIAIIVRCIAAVVYVYYLFMRNYFYQQAVTVNLSVVQIIKNAAIFGVAGIGRNLLAVVLSLAICAVCLLLHPLVELLLVPTLMFSMAGFVSVYCTYPITDKFIVQPAKAAEGKTEEVAARDEDLPPAVLPPELGGPGAGAHTKYISDDEPDERQDGEAAGHQSNESVEQQKDEPEK